MNPNNSKFQFFFMRDKPGIFFASCVSKGSNDSGFSVRRPFLEEFGIVHHPGVRHLSGGRSGRSYPGRANPPHLLRPFISWSRDSVQDPCFDRIVCPRSVPVPVGEDLLLFGFTAAVRPCSVVVTVSRPSPSVAAVEESPIDSNPLISTLIRAGA
ncbi:unnamed protein product [Cuscuta campestris]|uniref:Uncharacterized protein n=1 Tax=Cuscuta campestris TaxID=132261 RepID=A0A484KY50_9ASTE|nr:unnamed protein product [Cuscuta campestris]